MKSTIMDIKFSYSWERLRYSLLRGLDTYVAKTEIGTIPPRWIRILHFVLFPLHSIYESQSQVHYSLMSNYYTIRGVKISAEFFDRVSIDAEKGIVFKFVKNENGIITLERASNTECVLFEI